MLTIRHIRELYIPGLFLYQKFNNDQDNLRFSRKAGKSDHQDVLWTTAGLRLGNGVVNEKKMF